MKRNAFETVLGAVVILVAGAFFFFFYKTTDLAPTSGYTVTAAFSKIDGLAPGSSVRISGVKVGRVMDFKLDENYQALVTLHIDESVKLPMDTSATIASEGLLGGKFLSLEPGADEVYLEEGGRLMYTQSTPGLEQLLGQVIFSMTKDKKDEE